MRDLKEWLTCPDCGASGPDLLLEEWSYGWSVECLKCGEKYFWET